MIFIRYILLLACFLQMGLVLGKRSLTATSLVTCMDNSQISPTYFNVTFNPDDRSLQYTVDLTTEINGKVEAYVQVYAYGFLIIEKTVDMCTIGWKQFCPIYPGNMQVESIVYISKHYVNMIPGIAYYVPDIDAVVKVIVRDKETGLTLSCIQSNFSNGKTIAQTGAKWATAVVAGLGLLIAAILSTFGNSTAATHISANAVSLFLYFQSVVVVSMQSVERVPPIASAWAENLAWSMGLIRVQFMQDIFRWYVQSTGGTPDLYLKGTSKQILVQRAYDHLRNMHDFYLRNNKLVEWGKRSLNFKLNSNTNLLVFRGIKRIGYNSKIEPSSIVVTGFTFFTLLGYVLIAILFLMKQIVDLLIRLKKINPNFLNHFRVTFTQLLKGSLLRYIYIGFTQIVILSFWEFTQHDSAAVVVLAILNLLLNFSVLGHSFYKTLFFGRRSIQKFNNPAALLYGDNKILVKYGFCYTMFHAEKYWFGVVLIGYNLVKCIFIAFCQASGKASCLLVFILDLAYTIYLFIQKPYLNKSTNIINYLMSIVNTINSFLFLFFSDLFGQPAQVASVMGWVFFILNAAFSAFLLIMIIGFIVFVLISKNPDTRFAPAKDDRTSFQRKSSLKHKGVDRTSNKNVNELHALGAAAQDHNTNWENDLYNLNNLSGDNKAPLTPSVLEGKLGSLDEKSSNDDSEDTPEVIQEPQSFGNRLKNKLTRGLSMKSPRSIKDHGDTPKTDNKINRVSDTLNDENDSDTFDKDLRDSNTMQPLRQNSKSAHRNHKRLESGISTEDTSFVFESRPTDTRNWL